MLTELVIRTRRFETFHLGFRSLRAMDYVWMRNNDVSIRVLLTTLKDPASFIKQFSSADINLVTEVFYRDILLFQELSRQEGFELDYVYLDDPEHRLPNNTNIYPYVLHQSLKDSQQKSIFSLDDDIIYTYPGVFSEIEKAFRNEQSVFAMYLRNDRGMQKLRQQNPDIRLGHSAFLYAKNVDVSSKYFIDHKTSARQFADADAGKFVEHPFFVDLHSIVPRLQHPSRETSWDLRTEYFYHIGSVGCEHSGLVNHIYKSSNVALDSLFLYDLLGNDLNKEN